MGRTILLILLLLAIAALARRSRAANIPVVSITASANDGNLPSNAIDNNLGTRWSCPIPSGGACWLQADLGTTSTITTVGIAWYQGAQRTNTFSIQVSNDNTTFTTFFAGTSSGTTTSIENYPVTAVSARYVRISVTDNSLHNGWASITELAIPATAVLPIANMTAFSDDGNIPQNTLDNNLGTRWSCAIPQGGACWLQADLGKQATITSANIAWYQGNARTNNFSVLISADGTTFHTAFTGTSSGTTLGLEPYAVSPTIGRYVRVTVTDNSLHNGWSSITEFRVLGSESTSDAGTRDLFNITKLYASAPSGISWNSEHWANGHARDILDRDPDDPTGASQQRGDSSRLYVDGQGILHFFGTGPNLPEPRLYLNNPNQYFFKNVELTIYYLRVSDDNTPWGGIVLGARSGPDGHSPGGDPCTAHTYYGRIRHDAHEDEEKELKHPQSQARDSKNIWNGASMLPFGAWIGMKYVVYNVNHDANVKLEVYRDFTGGANGGTWEKVGETLDNGGWAPPQDPPACTYAPDFIPTVGGVVIILRDTGTSET